MGQLCPLEWNIRLHQQNLEVRKAFAVPENPNCHLIQEDIESGVMM